MSCLILVAILAIPIMIALECAIIALGRRSQYRRRGPNSLYSGPLRRKADNIDLK